MRGGETKPIPFIEEKLDSGILEKIDATDKRMLDYLGRMYKAMSGKVMNFEEIGNAIDALKMYNAESEYAYLNNLLHPEKEKGVKIPSAIPVPSCGFQLHNTVTLATNSKGNLAFVFNPYFLYNKANLASFPNNSELSSEGLYASTLWVNNDETLDGQNSNNNFIPVNIGQGIPDVYDQYRLVSASVIVRYIGRLDWVSGVIGGAIVFSDSRYIGEAVQLAPASEPSNSTIVYSANEMAKYGNFDLAMDSFYHQENLCVEGLRQLYFPLDGSFEDYIKLWGANLAGISSGVQQTETGLNGQINITSDEDYYKSGFNFFTYILGAPANQNCFKVDIFCNYECLPNAQFLNYMPISPPAPCISNMIKRETISIVQKNSIKKANENQEVFAGKPSIWRKMKEKFGNALPGIGTLLAKGLISAIPSLDLGLGLAGSLMNAAGMEFD